MVQDHGKLMLLNLTKHQWPDIDKIKIKSKYHLLINGREKVRIKALNNPEAFIDYSQTIDGVYENLEDYIKSKKEKKSTNSISSW